MNSSSRPSDAAPGGMRGSSRMYDPSETAHDRLRRRLMNVAFVAIALSNWLQWRHAPLRGWDWVNVLLLIVAAVPLGLLVKVGELRFKMAKSEWRMVLRDLPVTRQWGLVCYVLFTIIAAMWNAPLVTWGFWGFWLYDFATYYHDRPERIRHLYAVTKTLDELRQFPVPWAWPLPALVWSLLRMTVIR